MNFIQARFFNPTDEIEQLYKHESNVKYKMFNKKQIANSVLRLKKYIFLPLSILKNLEKCIIKQ